MYGFKSFGTWQFLAFRVNEQQLIQIWTASQRSSPGLPGLPGQGESLAPARDFRGRIHEVFEDVPSENWIKVERHLQITYRLSLDYQFPTVKWLSWDWTGHFPGIELRSVRTMAQQSSNCAPIDHTIEYITWIIISDHEWLNIKINSISIPGAFSATAPRALEVGVPANKGRAMAPRRWRSKWLPSSYH